MEVIMVETTKTETPVTSDMEVIDVTNSEKLNKSLQAPVLEVEQKTQNNGATDVTENSNITNGKNVDANKRTVSVVEITEMSVRKPPPSYTSYDHRRMSNENLSNVYSLLDIDDDHKNSELVVISNDCHRLSSPTHEGLSTPTVYVGDKADLLSTDMLTVSCDSGPGTASNRQDLNRGPLSTYSLADLSPNSIRSLLPVIAESSFESYDRESPIITTTQVQRSSFAESKTNVKDKLLLSTLLQVSPEIQDDTVESKAQDVEIKLRASSNNEVKVLKTLGGDVNIENNSPLIVIENTSHETTKDTTTNNCIPVDSNDHHESDSQITSSKFNSVEVSEEFETKDVENPSQIILDRKQSHTSLTCILHIDNSTKVTPKDLPTPNPAVNSEPHIKDYAYINHGESNFQPLKTESKDNDFSNNMNTEKIITENSVVTVTGSVLQDSESFETGAKSHLKVCDNESAKEELDKILQYFTEKLLYQDENEIVKENTMPQPVQKDISHTPNKPHHQDFIYIADTTSGNELMDPSIAEINLTDENRDNTVITIHTTVKDQQIVPNSLEKCTTTSDQKSTSGNGNNVIHDCEQNNTFVNSENMIIVLNTPTKKEITVPRSSSHIEVIDDEKSVVLEGNLIETGHLSNKDQVLPAPENNSATKNYLNLRKHSFRRHSTPAIDSEPFTQEPRIHVKNDTYANTMLTEITSCLSENINKDLELSRSSIKHDISNKETSNTDSHKSSTQGATNIDILNQSLTENITSLSDILRNNNEELCIDDGTLLVNENTNTKSNEGSNSNPNTEVDSSAVGTCPTDVKSQSLLEKCVLKLNLKPFFIKRTKTIKHEDTSVNPEKLNKVEVKDVTNETTGLKSDKYSNSVTDDGLIRELGTILPVVISNQVDAGSIVDSHDCNEMFNSVVNLEGNNTSEQQAQLGKKCKPIIEIVSEEDHIPGEDRQATFLQFSPLIKFSP